MSVLKFIVGGVVLIVAILALVITILPKYLDRIYYRGPVSDHFDGERFYNPDGDADTMRLPGNTGRAAFFWNQLTGRDGRPEWPDAVAVKPGKPETRVQGDRMVVTWICHASVLIQTEGLNILTDPVWSKRAGPFGFGPTRVAEPGIAFDDLPKIDVVLVSHNHYDHLDKSTLERLWQRDRPLILTGLGTDSIIQQTDAGAVALDWGQSRTIAPGIDVVATRAHHWTSRWFSDRNRALWTGFVVKLPRGNLFFAGDTGMGDGRWPIEAAAYGPIRLALIPIGAFRFVPGQMASGSHIGPADAVIAYQRSRAARAIPIHWGTFRLSFEGYDTPPRMLAAAMRCTGQSGFAPVAIGAQTEIPVYESLASSPPIDRKALLKCLDTPQVRTLR